MDKPSNFQLLAELSLVLVLVALLGLSPRPHSASKSLELARSALAQDSPLKASTHLASAAEVMPGQSGLWQLAGEYALAGSDPQKAIEYLERASKEDLSPLGWTQLGDAYQATGNLKEAVRAWEVSVWLSGPSKDLYQRLAQAHRSLGDIGAATTDLQTLVSLQPSDARSHYELGLLLATRQPEASLVYLARAVELDEQYAEAAGKIRRAIVTARVGDDEAYTLVMVGRTLASMEEWELAAEAFRQASQIRPDYAEAWAYLGEAIQHPSGKVALEASSPANRSEIEGELQRSEAETQTGGLSDQEASTADPAPGLIEIQKALELDPTSLSAHTFLALYWSRQGDYDQAVQALRDAVQVAPKNPAVHAELGNLLAVDGNLAEAHAVLLQAVELAPRQPAYLRLLAEFSLRYEYHLREIALPAARQAIILDPNDPASLDQMAQVLIKLGDQTNARRFLLRALDQDSGFALAHLHLGLLYLLEGETLTGYSELQLASSLAGDSPVGVHSNRLLQTYFP